MTSRQHTADSTQIDFNVTHPLHLAYTLAVCCVLAAVC